MSVPYLFLLTIVLSAWSAMIINVHSHTEAWQRSQIAVDNATTVIGQDDRVIFNRLQDFNKVMDGLIVAHHTAHLCAMNPLSGAACVSADRLLETFIPRFNKLSYKIANVAWMASSLHGILEMTKLNTYPFKIERAKQVPVHAEICEYGFETYLEVDKDVAPVVTTIKAMPKHDIELVKTTEEDLIVPSLILTSSCEVGGKSLKSGKKWNYKLKTGIKADYEG